MLDDDVKLKLKSLALLYVEDEDELREIMIDLLQRKFAKVHIAKNGKEGLSLFKSNDIDLIMTDIRMPIMGGMEMVHNIRQVNKKVPIIILSAHDDKRYLFEAIDNKITKYMVKPIEHSIFLATLNNLFKNKEISLKYGEKLFYYPFEKRFENNGISNTLTLSEHTILNYMNKHKNDVIQYEVLIGLFNDCTIDTIRTHIKNIRKKSFNSIIKTVPLEGYKLEN